MTVPVYDPAAWAAAGDTVAPTKTNRPPVPLNAAAVAAADGVNAVPPVCELVVLRYPVQVPIGRLFPPLVSWAGSVKVRLTFALFCPVKSKRPLASGRLGPGAARLTCAAALAGTILGAVLLSPELITRIPGSHSGAYPSFLGSVLLYLALQAAYSFRLKHVVILDAMLIATGKPQYLLYGLLCGYGFAWVGHFGFEKNKPASFKRPLYSFMGDWAMYKDIWTGKIPF